MKSKRIFIFLLLVVSIGILNHSMGWSKYLSDTNNWYGIIQKVEDNYFLAVILYIVLTMICCVVLALPGITFAIIAAFLFGPYAGTAICLTATTFGAVLSFLAGRFFLKDAVKPIVMKNKHLCNLLFGQTAHREVLILMITRLLPVFPYNLQNFAYGITDIGIIKYTICTLVFMSPGVALFTFGTAGVLDETRRVGYLIVAAVIVVLLAIAIKLLYGKYQTKD